MSSCSVAAWATKSQAIPASAHRTSFIASLLSLNSRNNAQLCAGCNRLRLAPPVKPGDEGIRGEFARSKNQYDQYGQQEKERSRSHKRIGILENAHHFVTVRRQIGHDHRSRQRHGDDAAPETQKQQ